MTEKDLIKNYVEQFRMKHIPERYNQIHLLDELCNDELDHYISISNRTDGKSFNYVHTFLNLAVNFNIKLCFLSRNMMLRVSYQTLIEEIIDWSPVLKREDFQFIRTQYYVTLRYKKEDIAVLSSLNDATEIKYFSNYLKHFPIMIYDEFLALESDYLSDEYQRLKTIYESIDRLPNRPYINKPKIFYFGNAVNFESPILHGLNLFNILEKHPINSHNIYGNVMLEMNKNENANDDRNIRAFSSEDDSMTTGQFERNDHNVATPQERNHIKRNPRKFYVKLRDNYLSVSFNRDTFMILLSIENRMSDDYDYIFNMLLKDNKETSRYLNEKYYDDNHYKKIDKGKYLFDNNFSKNFITNDFIDLKRLRINKLIREYLKDETPELESKEKENQFYDNYIEMSKRAIAKKFME